MECPYSGNWLCSRLPQSTRETLCAHCSVRKYAQGQHLSEGYFAHMFVLVLDGLMAKMEIDSETRRLTASGIGTSGRICSIGDLFAIPDKFTSVERTTICITDCTFAVWDMATVRALFDADIRFAQLIFENTYVFCLKEKTLMMRDIGSGNVYSAVRYVIKRCHDEGIPQLTHEQLALLCSRSRPAVTNALHELIRREPEIFQ